MSKFAHHPATAALILAMSAMSAMSATVGCGSGENAASNVAPDASSIFDGGDGSDHSEASLADGEAGQGDTGNALDAESESGVDGALDATLDGPEDGAMESAAEAGLPLYLVSIDHAASPSRLLKIDVQTGLGTVVCNLPLAVDGVNYHSTTFSRAGMLYASNYQSASLDLIDPCSCEVTPLGPTGAGAIPGITANKTLGLYGIDTTNDDLVDLSVDTGLATIIGALGADFTTAGATWSDDLNTGEGGLFGLNGATSQLYEIDTVTGVATPTLLVTGVTIGSVGIELHPFNGEMYICTNDAVLYRVDIGTGEALPIGAGMGHVSQCNNLAAPWKHVACLAD